MKKTIFWLTVFCISFVLTTTSNAQSAKVKQSTNQTATAWPECCWVGKTTASTNAAPEQKPESASENKPSSESTSGAAPASSGSGASFTSSGSEQSSESSEEQGSKEKSLKQKLTDTALELLKDKLTNKQSGSSDTSTSSDNTGASENTASTNSIGTSSTETTPPVDSVQEVKQTDPNKRRQRMQALRERMQNSKSNATTTNTDANTPTETVQEVPGGRRRARRGQQNTDTVTTPTPNETNSARVRPQRNQPTEQPAQTNARERPLHNNNGGMVNSNRVERVRAAREARQNAPKPRPGNMRRKP